METCTGYRIPVVLGFEGWDAAGKGGAIKRLTSHLDPRGYQGMSHRLPQHAQKKPTTIYGGSGPVSPRHGHMAVFDRTWYGRVMVERIEGFCTEEEWQQGLSGDQRYGSPSGAIPEQWC